MSDDRCIPVGFANEHHIQRMGRRDNARAPGAAFLAHGSHKKSG
jgi:hypothetical protein